MNTNPSREPEWNCVTGEGELSISELNDIMTEVFGHGVPEEYENYPVSKNQEIVENSVDIRAKLEQLTEECGELIHASMKLIRAIGNGNPTVIGRDEAVAKLVEEWSDVTVAMKYILPRLQEEVDFDILERIEKIGKFKEQRWIERVRKERENEDYHLDGDGCCDSCDL